MTHTGGQHAFQVAPRLPGMDSRGDIDADDLLKIILALVVLWLVVEVLGGILDIIGWLLGPFRGLFGLIVIILIILYLLDRI